MAVGGRATKTSDASAGRQVGIADPGQRLGDGGVGGQHHGLGRHQAARGVGGVAQQPSHVLGVLGVHPAQELLGVGRGHRAQQVGGVVGVHRLEHVGGAFGLQLPQHVGLLVFGQLLQHVGEPLVVERLDHLVAALGGQLADGFGDLDRALALELFEQLGHALVGHRESGRRQALHPIPVGDVRRCCGGPACAAAARPPS